MGPVVVSNAWLKARCQAAVDLLNSGHFLYLFINDFEPTPADTLASFDPATFPGSDPIDLVSKWPDPIKIQDGAFASAPSKFDYTCTGPANETVYGWYVKEGTVVKLSARLFAPVPVIEDTEFEVRIIFETWALSELG